MGHCLPLTLEGDAQQDTPFVGHAALLGELREMFVRTEGIAARPTIVLGEAGFGKSRLLRELSALWPAGVSAIALRCEPNAPFGRTTLEEQLRFALDASGPRRFAADENETLEVRLRTVAARRPLMCLVDDLHLASLDDIDLFEALANECRRARLALVGTCSSEARSGAPVAALLNRWARASAPVLTIPALDRSAAELLLRNLLAAHATFVETGAKEAILEVAAGNPRYIAELVDGLGDRPASSALPVPRTANTKVAELRQLLSPAAFELLRTASVFGHPFTDDWMTRLCPGRTLAALAGALQECVDAGVLFELGEAAVPAFTFHEPAVRYAFYASLITPQRRQTHAHIAQTLTALRTDSEHDALIARHWIQAGRPDAAIEWLGRAAEYEAARSHYREAIELDRFASELVEAQSYAYWDIQRRLAANLAAFGDFKGAAVVRRALALHLLAKGRIDEGNEQLFNLMHDYWYEGRPHFAEPIYRKLQRTVIDPERRVHVDLGWADICGVGGRRDEAARVIAALNVEAHSNPEIQAMYLRQSALLGSRKRPVETTMAMFDRAFAIAHDAKIYRDEVYVGMTAANTASEVGDLEAAHRWIERVEAALAERPELATGTTALAALLRCELSLLRGRVGRARDALGAFRFAERLGTYWESCFCGFAVFIGQRLGDPSWVNAYFRPELLDHVLRSGQIEGVAIVVRGFAETLVERGMQETLQNALTASIDAELVDPYCWIQLHCARYGAPRDLETARAQIEAQVGDGHDTVARGALALFDAFVARRTNAARPARKAALAAAQTYRELGWRWVEALSLEVAGERAAASQLYAECGALRDVERLSGRTRKARRAAFGSTLTPREEQISALVGQGMTNREIAQRLRRSERTINHHVEAIFSKQGIRARWQLGSDHQLRSK